MVKRIEAQNLPLLVNSTVFLRRFFLFSSLRASIIPLSVCCDLGGTYTEFGLGPVEFCGAVLSADQTSV